MGEIRLYEENQPVLQKTQDLFVNHTERHGRAREHFNKIVNAVNENGLDDDMYQQITGLLKRYVASKKKFNEERAPLTTSLANISKLFVAIESDFDYKKEGSMAHTLKKMADQYAYKKKQEEDERIRQQQKVKLYNAEVSNIKIKAEVFIKMKITKYLGALKSRIDGLLNSIDLENYEEVRQEIITLNYDIPSSIFSGFKDTYNPVNVSIEEMKAIYTNALKSDEYNLAMKDYEDSIVVYIQEANAKIPAIIEELKAIVEAEDQEKQKQLADERHRRIAQELQDKKEESEKQKQSIQHEVETKQASAKIQSEFDFSVTVGEVKDNVVKKKVNYRIELVLPGGIAQIVNFWLQNANIGEDMDKIGRWTIDRMIKFAEKEASKNDNKIISDYVKYEEEVSAKI